MDAMAFVRRFPLPMCAAAVAAVVAVLLPSAQRGGAQELSKRGYGKPSELPLPHTLSVVDYERQLFAFLNARQYRALGWAVDKGVRDTGPYKAGRYYGTHPAVRIYYSPEIIAWLLGGKQDAIPDGAMMVKEQYPAPAVQHQGLDDDALFARLSSWTVMVKDSRGSYDGWFWSNPAKEQEAVDNHRYPFDHPVSGFGIYCVRCHASTKTTGATNEYTFAALRNVKGFPGEPIEFEVDDSWRTNAPATPGADAQPAKTKPLDDTTNESMVKRLQAAATSDAVHPRCTGAAHPELCPPVLNQRFLEQFASIGPRPREQLAMFPPVTHDWVVRRPAPEHLNQPFVTSNQCMSCHAGLLEPFGPTMFMPTTESIEYAAEGVHVSPYGEWRWTPMGLAGRDPVFFAQLESELALLEQDLVDDPDRCKELSRELVKTCLSCHGVMGKRQFDLDGHADGHAFGVGHVMRSSTDPGAAGHEHWRYGALARDGVSCTVCHLLQPREQPADDGRPYLEFFLETSITGNLNLGPANELHGPFEDKELAPYAMEHALGYKPKHNAYIKSSQMCGTCHVVNLPIVDRPAPEEGDEGALIAAEQNPAFKGFYHHVEQATYLEWLNSEFENEFHADNPQAKTCQDCHMSRDYHHEELGVHADAIKTRIAAIQDNTYPEAENLATREELEVRVREEGFARHNFRGLNVFLLEMFNQFDDVLGVRKYDFMTGSTEDIPHAQADFVRQAREETATVDVAARRDGEELVAVVNVHNKVGHRFPSGVGFRRAFLELLVVDSGDDREVDAEDPVVWSSGRTNELGVLVDADGAPLPCEFFSNDATTNKQSFQPHHEVITSPGQVQIYETLLWSGEHKFTTSFIHGSEVVKDNRLLPRGWKPEGPDPALNGAFLRATYPCPTTRKDPRYGDGSGSDEVTYRIPAPEGVDPSRLAVRATLYYQAMPPYFLKSLFDTAPNGPATQRLHYIASNIELRGTPIADWKLMIATDAADVE
jgi:hypothetical protein